MNTIEERLRAATHAAADTVASSSAPPLRLPARPGRRRGLHLPRHLTAWRVIAPVAAAAAVVAVIMGSLVVTGGAHGPAAGRSWLAMPGSTSSALSPAARAALGRVQPYYVALEPGPLSGDSTRAVVRATATGGLLATITPPAPYQVFTELTAAADDRTFVLAAQEVGEGGPPSTNPTPQKYFMLRLDPADGTTQLTALSIPEQSPDQVSDIALAPDGSRLAIALEQSTQAEIMVINLRTGSTRTWKGTHQGNYSIGGVVMSADPLSWTADGQTLAFEEEAPLAGKPLPGQPLYNLEVRLLDTTAPGDDLWSSRVVPIPGDAANAMITPDGTKIVAPVVTQTAREVAEFSASTGELVAVLGVRHYRQAYDGGWPILWWVSSSGSTVIVDDAMPGSALTTANGDLGQAVLAEVTGSQFTPLPGSDQWVAW
jgi:hypothetical protein